MSDLLLDTCALLWLAHGGGELGKSTIKAIDEAGLVQVSAITAWELGLLAARKQIALQLPVAEWFENVCETHHLHVLNITPAIAFAANQLPWHHRDPADRFILATAQLQQLTIVTRDKLFQAYSIPLIG